MFSKFLLFSFLFLCGCALFEERTGPPEYFGPREQTYIASFEEVWRAANLVFQPYPIAVSKMDQGQLETDQVKSLKAWMPPYKETAPTAGLSYKLSLKILRGRVGKQSATRVTILKEATVAHDFVSEPRPIASDGMEEKTLLYRIGREIALERKLTRSQKKR